MLAGMICAVDIKNGKSFRRKQRNNRCWKNIFIMQSKKRNQTMVPEHHQPKLLKWVEMKMKITSLARVTTLI
jgi:ribosomal protein L24E